DGEVSLHEGAEGGVELEGAVLGVAEELALERHPGLPRGAAVDPDEVLKIQGDGPEDPGHGDAVEAQPRHVPRLDRQVNEDVVVEGVAADGEQDLVPPAAVGGGRGVEEDGDQSPDVLDAGRLEVELGDHGVSRVVPSSSSSDRGLA